MTHEIRFHSPQPALLSTMGYQRTSKVADLKERVQTAILAYRNQEYKSVRAAAAAFSVSYRTLLRRLAGGLSRA
jgi:hypothetical protein